MSESLADLLATDAQLDLLAQRRSDAPADVVLAELAMLATAVDAIPLPSSPVVLPSSPVVQPDRCVGARTRKGGWALTVTAALMLTTSGVAAAVSDDPLAPLHYVARQVLHLGPHDNGKLPGWELGGSVPISTAPSVGSRPSAESRRAPVAPVVAPGRPVDRVRAPGGAVRASSPPPPSSTAGGDRGHGGASIGFGHRPSGRKPPNSPSQGTNHQLGGRPGGSDGGNLGAGGPKPPQLPHDPGQHNRNGDPGGAPSYGRVPGVTVGAHPPTCPPRVPVLHAHPTAAGEPGLARSGCAVPSTDRTPPTAPAAPSTPTQPVTLPPPAAPASGSSAAGTGSAPTGASPTPGG